MPIFKTAQLNFRALIKTRLFTFYSSSTRCTPQAIPTAIFFMQSVGLILKDAKFFGLLGALNLDLEAATGQVRCCVRISATSTVWSRLSQPPLQQQKRSISRIK